MFSLLKIFLNLKKLHKFTLRQVHEQNFFQNRGSKVEFGCRCFTLQRCVLFSVLTFLCILGSPLALLNASKCYRKVNIWRESTHGFYLWPMQGESFNQISSFYDANINRWSLNVMIFLDINFHAQTTFTFRLSCVNKLTTTK